MNRRNLLLAAVAASVLGRIGAVSAQSRPAPVVIGWLNMGSRETHAHLLAAFKDGLAALGWKEGTQIVIEERWAGGTYDRLQSLAEELAEKKPAVLVTATSRVMAAAAKAAPRTPIVQANGADPVVSGFAASLARPGGMVTGISNAVTDLSEKFLELLLAAAPKLRRVGFLVDPETLVNAAVMEAARRSVAAYSIEARFGEVHAAEEIDPVIARLAQQGAQALVVLPSPLFVFERRRIARLALSHRWPVIAGPREYAEAGALLSYSVDLSANYRRAAYYVDRILKGAHPGNLLIEQPMRIELAINLQTAKALQLEIPRRLLIRADRVIE